MRIKAIFMDLDRTLLRDDKRVSPYTADVLSRCRAAGIKIAFATARARNSAVQVVEALGRDGLVCSNGALVKQGEETLAEYSIPRADALGIIGVVLQAVPSALVSADAGGNTYGNFAKPPNWPTYHQIEDFSAPDFSVAEKLVFSVDNESRQAVEALMEAHVRPMLPENMHIEYDRFGHAVVQRSEATKLNGIRALCDWWGIPLLYAAAFGDDYGDISMLGGVGWGVAVENAIAEVKAAADMVCPGNNDDGVARWLEANVLSELG